MTTDVHVEPRWIEIPSVYGMSVREATDRLAEAGFTPVASPRRFSAGAEDVIGGTRPPEGSAQRRTGRIDLIPLGRGAEIKPVDEKLSADQLLDLGIMPNLSGMSADSAIAFVQAHGFHTWPRGTFTDRVEPDFVVFTEPRAGTLANFEPVVIWYAVPVPPPDPVSGMPPEMIM